MNRLELIEQIDLRLAMIRNEQKELVAELSELLTEEEKEFRYQRAIAKVFPQITGKE